MGKVTLQQSYEDLCKEFDDLKRAYESLKKKHAELEHEHKELKRSTPQTFVTEALPLAEIKCMVCDEKDKHIENIDQRLQTWIEYALELLEQKTALKTQLQMVRNVYQATNKKDGE